MIINNHKNLKAIKEGIKTGFKFSSSNINDDSSYINFNDSKVNKVESLNLSLLEKQIIENDFIDLGFSTLWAKSNLGATCENNSKSWYGKFYSWGELKPKIFYDETHYDNRLLDKYTEKYLVLKAEDDIVTQTYYGIKNFRIPSKDDIKDLIKYTTTDWVTNYNNINGLNGIVFTSIINKNSIFIPAAGSFYENRHNDESEYIQLWTSSFENKIDADGYNNIDGYYVSICDTKNIIIDNCGYFYGLSIRGVYS